MDNSLCGLYAITPDGADFATLVRMVSAALKGGVKLIQYRQKHVDPENQLTQARELNELC